MAGAVYVHVGMKRTGTSYLQSILRASTDELRRQGLSLVPRHEPAGHRLAMAVLGQPTSGNPLAALPRQVAAAPGSRCLVTQESLGRADHRQIERLRPALDGHEIHVVVTVRDIARTIPSAWQHYVRGGRARRFDRYLDDVMSGEMAGAARPFWLDHGVLELAERWARLATPSFTHVVVVPSPGEPPEALLERFCRVIEIEPAGLATAEGRPNESLGLVQIEVLRRLNEELRPFAPRVHGKVYKREFVRGVMAGQRGRRPLMPAASAPWCREYTDRVVEGLVSGAYDVVGDLEDLRPPESAFTTEPQTVSDAELGECAIVALRCLLDRRASEVELARASNPRRRQRKAAPEPS